MTLLQYLFRECLSKNLVLYCISWFVFLQCYLFIFKSFNSFSIKQRETDRNKKLIAATKLWPEPHTEVEPCSTAAEPPKKDAFTSTEGYEELLNKRRLEEDRYHRLDDEVELRSRLLSKRLDEDLDVPSRRHRGFPSQSVIPIRRYHRLDEDRDFDRRYYRMDYEPEISEEFDSRFRCESAYERKPPRYFYAERYL